MAGAAERRNKMLNEHASDYAYSEGKALMPFKDVFQDHR